MRDLLLQEGMWNAMALEEGKRSSSVPVPPEPGKPEPTELDYLKRIAESLEAKKK